MSRTRLPAPRLPLALAAVLLSLWPCVASAQAFSQSLRVDLGAIGNPGGIACADLNNDGRLDLVICNDNAASVSVFLGSGNGGYGPRADYATGAGVHGVAIGDVNGDGRPDIVTANVTLGSVSVLLGNGAGGFGPRTDYTAGSITEAVALGDVNGDGRLDIVTANAGANSVSVLLGTGTGAFGTRTDYATGSYPFAVALGDMNGDGRLDIVATNYSSNTVSVLLGTGTGAFGAKADYATGSGPDAVALGDVNGDGRLDVAVANQGANTASVLLGDGTGALLAKTDFVLGVTGSGVAPIALADVTGDGKPDIVGASYSVGTVSVLAGNGAGSFATKVDYPVGTGPYGVAVGDFNGDGRLDIAAANFTGNSVSVLFATPTGMFATRTDMAAGSFPLGCALGDLNGDGKLDLVVANTNSASISVFPGIAVGAFGTRTDYATGTSPYAVAIGDVTGDGKPDLVVTNSGGSTVSVFPGNGSGGFGARADYTTGSGPRGVALVDVNGDGLLDIVTANAGVNTVSVLVANAAGGFAAKTDNATGTSPYEVVAADLNGDGRPDLVTANYSGTVSVLLNYFGTSFYAYSNYVCGYGAIALALGDLNGDGKLDAVTANFASGSVSVLLGTGTGGFGAKTDFATPADPNDITIGDVNGDGRLDVVTACWGSSFGLASVLQGNGAGGLGAHVDYGVGSTPQGVALGDLNGDGRLDAVVTNSGTSTASVLLNSTPTRMALTTSQNPAVLGVPPTLTATVAGIAPSSGTPTGTVAFYDGATPLGSAPLSGNTATIGYLGWYAGARALTAVYSGDSRFTGAVSPVLQQNVAGSAAPALAAIRDVPNDQGGKVSLRWSASALDAMPSDLISSCVVWRQAPNHVALAALRAGAHLLDGAGALLPVAGGAWRTTVANAQTYYWEYLGSQIAQGLPGYSFVAPTTADSVAGSNPYTLFMIEAVGTGGQAWFSAPDSGYSVDNIAPPPVAPFTGTYSAGATALHWGESTAPDFASFRLYRGGTPGFTPGAGNLVASPVDTGYVDYAGSARYYAISAVDAHGNESAFTYLLPSGTAAVGDGAPLAFALELVSPNPSRGGRIVVAFALPTAAGARLELLDVSGRRIAVRDAGALGAGRHSLELAEGRTLPAGLYLLRLTQGSVARVTRLAVTR